MNVKKFIDVVKQHPQDALIALSLVALVLVALAAFAPQALLVATGVGVLAWASYTPPTPPVIDHGYEQWYTFLSYLLHKYENVWNTIPPVEPAHMAPCWPPLIQRGGVEIIRAEIDKKRGSTCIPGDEFAKTLRRTIDFELAGGRGENIPFDSPDGRVPIFYPLNVEETPGAYIVDVAYLNTPQQYNATKRIVTARQQQRHARRHPPQGSLYDDDL